jgi:hypothetical protein
MIFEFIAGILWSFIKLYLLTCWGFLAAIKLKELKARGELTPFWMTGGYILYPTFLVLDALFNIIWGSIIFKELPRLWGKDRELLFTDRCKRHYRAVARASVTTIHTAKTMKRYRTALRWKNRLNVIEEDHIY